MEVFSFPGSCTGEEKREPNTHCSCMCQVPRYYATLKLHSISVYMLRRSVNLKGKECDSHEPQCLDEIDESMDNFCKQRAKCLFCSLFTIYTECGQW